MGMYDYVVELPEIQCPHCKSKLTGWQSKDGPCDLIATPYWEVNNFYTHCDECGTWVEFNLKAPRGFLPLEAYEMSTRFNSFQKKVKLEMSDIHSKDQTREG